MGRLNYTSSVKGAILVLLSLGLMSRVAQAELVEVAHPEVRCASGEAWDTSMSMCMPAPGVGRPTRVVADQFNVFGVFSTLQGPRGVDQFAAPNWFMIDAGRSVGARQFVNVDLMGTAELWTYPRHGYPELLQVGEERSDGSAYIDAQHPHSSPIMGLTFSDTIALTDGQSLKLYFAPRGESTDGPVAYIHRASARDIPDAPLGHHVGQDVGHISSTVVGAQWRLDRWIVEGSAFSGAEPEPTKVDLPLNNLDSIALRLIYAAAGSFRVLGSVAHVQQSDPTYPGTTSATRLSASIYNRFSLRGTWSIDHAFIAGSISRRPAGATLSSFLDELTATRGPSDLWGRLELLQRLGSELEIPNAGGVTPAEDKRWVAALTVGYTYWRPWFQGVEFGTGVSLTADVIPGAWSSAYGSHVPLTGRLIFQLRGRGQKHP